MDKIILTTEDELKKIILDCISKKEPEEILTTEQVCEMFHMDRGTVYDYKKAGIFPAYGLKGKRVWYKKSEVLAALVRINGKAA